MLGSISLTSPWSAFYLWSAVCILPRSAFYPRSTVCILHWPVTCWLSSFRIYFTLQTGLYQNSVWTISAASPQMAAINWIPAAGLQIAAIFVINRRPATAVRIECTWLLLPLGSLLSRHMLCVKLNTWTFPQDQSSISVDERITKLQWLLQPCSISGIYLNSVKRDRFQNSISSCFWVFFNSCIKRLSLLLNLWVLVFAYASPVANQDKQKNVSI